MRYVQRDAGGAVCAVFTTPQPDAREQLPDGHPDLLAFLGMSLSQTLGESDLALVRVIEDLVDLLVQKGVILFTELPAQAQSKLLKRGRLRQGLDPVAPFLSDDRVV